MKGYLIDVTNKENYVYGTVEFEEKLSNLYELINCRLIDIVRDVNINGVTCDIVVDDEGLLTDNPIPTAVCLNVENYRLYGNLLIVRSNAEGGMEGLSNFEASTIEKWIHVLTDPSGIFPRLAFEINR